MDPALEIVQKLEFFQGLSFVLEMLLLIDPGKLHFELTFLILVCNLNIQQVK